MVLGRFYNGLLGVFVALCWVFMEALQVLVFGLGASGRLQHRSSGFGPDIQLGAVRGVNLWLP